MKHQYQDGALCLYFEGEFDNLSVMKLKEPSIRLIEQYRPRVLKLDFEKVSFVDSTGIGYVLARYKQMKKAGAVRDMDEFLDVLYPGNTEEEQDESV